MTKQHLEQVVAAISHDFVSEEEEQVVEELFQQFSSVVGQINRRVLDNEVHELILSYQIDLPYLKRAEIIRCASGVENDTAKPYKNFEVTFQNATVQLRRKYNKWVFYYSTTS